MVKQPDHIAARIRKLSHSIGDGISTWWQKSAYFAQQLGILNDRGVADPDWFAKVKGWLTAEKGLLDSEINKLTPGQVTSILESTWRKLCNDRSPAVTQILQPAVDEIDLAILREMAMRPTRLWTLQGIEGASRIHRFPISRKTIGKRMVSLIRLNLVDKTKKRGGLQITPLGISVLEKDTSSQ